MVKIFKPDWTPEKGQEDRGLQASHGTHEKSISDTNPAIGKDPVEFREKYPRIVIPEK